MRLRNTVGRSGDGDVVTVAEKKMSTGLLGSSGVDTDCEGCSSYQNKLSLSLVIATWLSAVLRHREVLSYLLSGLQECLSDSEDRKLHLRNYIRAYFMQSISRCKYLMRTLAPA